YEPATDESLPVMVSVQASEIGNGILLDVRVTENGEQASRLSAVFPKSSRLETDARGRRSLVTSLPPRSESIVIGAFGRHGEIIDQLFVFFRRAIGTEVEAQESRLRTVGTPVSVKRVDGGGARIEYRTRQGNLVCDGRFEMVASKDVRSSALT